MFSQGFQAAQRHQIVRGINSSRMRQMTEKRLSCLIAIFRGRITSCNDLVRFQLDPTFAQRATKPLQAQFVSRLFVDDGKVLAVVKIEEMLTGKIPGFAIVNPDHWKIIGIRLVLPVTKNNREMALSPPRQFIRERTIIPQEQPINT